MGRHWGEDWSEDYPHRDITEAIIRAAIRLQKALGPGILEDAYKICLAHALSGSFYCNSTKSPASRGFTRMTGAGC